MLTGEHARLAALRGYGVLDTLPEDSFDRLTSLAAEMFEAPMALISLVDEDRVWFKSKVGLEFDEAPRAHAFCDHAISIGPNAVLVVPDATIDDRFAENPNVAGDLGVRFYAGAALTTPEGHNVGTLCVVDVAPRAGPSDQDVHRLRVLAKMVVNELELVRATRLLAEQSRLLGLAEGMSGVGHWRIDLESNQVTWSDGVYKIHGVERGSFDPNIATGVGFFHPEDQHRVSHLLARATSHQEDFAFQLRLNRADGEVRHVISSGTCDLDPSGGTRAIIGVFQDVTDQVRRVEAIERSEKRYKLLAEHIGDVVTRIRLDGSSSYISPAIEALLGYKPEEMRGQTAQAFVYPDDQHLILATFVEMSQGLSAKTILHRASHKAGHAVWVETQFKMVRDGKGRPTEIIAVIRDVSARKAAEDQVAASEARYRRLADNASDIVTESNLAGQFTYVSPAVVAITGSEPSEFIGKTAIDLVHPEDRLRVRAEIDAALQFDAPRQIEHRHICKDGRVIWVQSRPALARDPVTKQAVAITNVMRDITERKTLELDLLQARIAAEAAADVKSQFLSNMSHELRTPLTSILGFSSLLKDEPGLTGLARRAAERISGSSQALMTIVNDILDFSKLETGMVEIERRVVDPQRSLKEALDLLQPQADAKGLSLTYRSEFGLPSAVSMDDERVRQILLNLIGNAVKFTAKGGVTLSAHYDAGLGRLRCEVIDTGIGVPADQVDRLFKRFSQVDASTTRAFGGTGLGLAICKGLAEAMGGEIGVMSEVGKGACFWFELPCPPAEVQSAPPGEAAISHDEGLQGVRLLVADDNASNRELLRAVLEPYGVEITEAINGEEAVGAATQAPFDLIFMDERMPIMDGPAAARAIINGGGPNDLTPILAFTANGAEAALGGASAGLFVGHVAKPISLGELISTIEYWTAPQTAPLLEEAALG